MPGGGLPHVSPNLVSKHDPAGASPAVVHLTFFPSLVSKQDPAGACPAVVYPTFFPSLVSKHDPAGASPAVVHPTFPPHVSPIWFPNRTPPGQARRWSTSPFEDAPLQNSFSQYSSGSSDVVTL